MDKFLRLRDIIGDKTRGIEPIIPVSRSTWYKGCRSGRFPAPIKLGERLSVWRESDVLAFLERMAEEFSKQK